jgi:N-acetylglucosamine kinase-like BadF-type ATPase
MNDRLVLAVDGGNSKTDLALVAADGRVLALVRGDRSSPQYLGAEGSLDVIERLLDEALFEAGLTRTDGPIAEIASFLLAGLDFPSEERDVDAALRTRNWANRTFVGNDTFAVLRAGTERGWGVAVVCGSGINCVGVAPDGRHARFPSLGAITGDWGGGYDVGLAAVFAAARSEDGRGSRTTLEHAVPAYFGLRTPQELAEAIHRGQIQQARAIELPPVVFAEASRDAVAAEIVDRLSGEIVALARVALTRLDLTREPVEVLLGGGLLQSSDGRLVASVRAGLEEIAPEVVVRRMASAPIVGAVLLAMDRIGATAEAKDRARADLSSTVDEEFD